MGVCGFFILFFGVGGGEKHITNKERARVRVFFFFHFASWAPKHAPAAAPLGPERATVGRPLHPFCLLPRYG